MVNCTASDEKLGRSEPGKEASQPIQYMHIIHAQLDNLPVACTSWNYIARLDCITRNFVFLYKVLRTSCAKYTNRVLCMALDFTTEAFLIWFVPVYELQEGSILEG